MRGWRSILAAAVRASASRGNGITNDLIERLCKLVCGDEFSGTYAADYLPLEMSGRPRFAAIVNLGRRRGIRTELPVGHFVVLVGRPAYVVYFDPYGLPPFQRDVVRFLESCDRPVRHSNVQLQSVSSQHCGLYAVLALCILLGRAEFDALFYAGEGEAGYKKNDRLCRKYLRRIFSAG